MKHPWLVLSCSAALSVPLAWIGSFGGNASAQQTPLPPPVLFQDPSAAPSTELAPPATNPSDVLEEVPLAPSYEIQSAGISFRPPVDCRMVSDINQKYLAEGSDETRDWTLKLGEMKLERPAPLVSTKDNFGKDIEGILNRTVRNLQSQLPGGKILRQDVTNTRDGGGRYEEKHPEARDNVGLIAIRYTVEGHRRLSQQAIVHVNDSLYYLLTLTSPGSSSVDGNAPDDPRERVAAETFSRILDSIRVLDRSAIKRDQDERLYHTRTALVNWTPEKLHRVLVNEQWVRIIKNGKDIGYTYITEEESGGIPKPLTAKQMRDRVEERDIKPKGDGILIGVRARMIADGLRADKTKGPIQTDSASWFFVSADKKHEDFSRVIVIDDHKASKKGYMQEFGISEKRVRRVVERPPAPAPGVIVVPNNNIVVALKEDWELDVNLTANVVIDPVIRKLPPWYVPQALSHLLPRLLPLDRPQGYLFASYVSDAREVVMRYIDVLPEQTVQFNGQAVRAIPIRDRLGLEGSVTFHYMTIDGVYVGSENKDQKFVMLPTNSDTLQQIWKDANLTRPGAVERGGAANVDARIGQ